MTATKRVVSMRSRSCAFICCLILLASAGQAQFRAGAARREITPTEPVPMWGYGDRHDALSAGILDPLHADALVLECAGKKLAIVSLDLGRAPTERSLQIIRKRIKEEAGIEFSFIAGSHTHHGPVLELSDEPGKGKGKFDAALRYYPVLEDNIVGAILEANSKLTVARMATGTAQLQGFNRNRQTKIEPKPVDAELAVLRIDDDSGKPVAIVVNFTGHPTTIPSSVLKFSADYVGAMKNEVTGRLGAATLFMLHNFLTDSQGYRWIRLNRSIHTGDIGGFPGHVIMSLSSLLLVVMAITGIVIWLKKLTV